MSKLTGDQINAIIDTMLSKAEETINKLNQKEEDSFKLPKQIEEFIPSIIEYYWYTRKAQEIDEKYESILEELQIKDKLLYNPRNLYRLLPLDTSLKLDKNKPKDNIKTMQKFLKENMEKELIQYHYLDTKEIKRELILTGISSQFDIDKIINNISKYIK